MKICSICGIEYEGYGNNAWPVNLGRCCDSCNQLVIINRLRNVHRGGSAYEVPQWYHELAEQYFNQPSEPKES